MAKRHNRNAGKRATPIESDGHSELCQLCCLTYVPVCGIDREFTHNCYYVDSEVFSVEFKEYSDR